MYMPGTVQQIMPNSYCHYDIQDFSWKSRRERPLGKPGVDGRTDSLDSAGSGKGSAMGSCEHGNETSGTINGGEFFDQLRNYQILRGVL
jgi:hypothetical protein